MTSRGYRDQGELTPRMRDVLDAAGRGLGVAATAAELHVSYETVRTVRAAALVRLEAANVTAAVLAAERRGALPR